MRRWATPCRRIVAVVFDDDVERLAERAMVDHHVAGDDQACAAVGPAAVDAREFGGRLVGRAGESSRP